MLDPFRLRGTFGADYSVDGDDILRTKKALNKLGHFDDKESINPYADNRMIDGLKSFQRVRGLEPDGIMKPDGPTARELSKALAESDTRPHQRGLVAEGRFDPPSRHLPTTLPTRKPHRPQARPWDEHLPTEDALFRLLGDVGRGRRNDPRDVLTIRRALGWAGDLAPKKGLEELGADDDLFAAIDRFQARTGAKRDGWMGKGGETEKALNTEIFPKVKAQAAPPPHNDLDGGRESEEEAEVALWDKVLQQGLRLLPGLAGGAAAQKAAEEIQKNAPNEQREMTPPPAPVPPNRPPGLHVPDRTETPAKAPVMDLDLTRPLPEATEPTIFINPVLPDYMQTAGTIVDRNETEATKAQIDRIRDEFRNKTRSWTIFSAAGMLLRVPKRKNIIRLAPVMVFHDQVEKLEMAEKDPATRTLHLRRKTEKPFGTFRLLTLTKTANQHLANLRMPREFGGGCRTNRTKFII